MIKPRIAIVPGDPSGIGPELIAKLLNDVGVMDAANIVLVGVNLCYIFIWILIIF